MGITGVNFAAPDGTLVFVENESNLRLSMTLPPVQVAIMGLEKLIPTLADVEVFLRLLPASATGQRLTALVHFLRGRKFRPGGSQDFYLIILDNGRRRLARDPEFQEALYCLRCGACLNVCPIFQLRAAHLYRRVYPGAIGILLAPHLNPAGDLSDLCTQCGACQEICPVKISLAEKILQVRARSPRWRGFRALSGLAGRVLARPRLYRGLEPGLRLLQAASFPRGSAVCGAEVIPPQLSSPAAGRGISPGEDSGRHHRPGPDGTGPAESAPGLSSPYRRRDRRGPDPGGSPGGGGRHLAPGAGTGGTGPAAGAVGATLVAPGPSLAAAGCRGTGAPGGDAPFGRRRLGPPGETAVLVGLGAIPETGSVLIEAASGPAAALSFRVRRLVVVVPDQAAHLSLAQALELTARQAPGLVTWLTGPSRTADIEKVLVLGAHGPKELHVVLYQPEA